MVRTAFARIVLFAVMFAPVVRATCGASCLHGPDPAPPPCHGDAPASPRDNCSHDHDGIVARVGSPSIEHHVAILPAVIVSVATPHDMALHMPGEGRPLVPRASPQAILRV
ncbi:MAG TPA: hypothetical protein VHI98_01750 [Vicinamibacterales bacterium]|nr:hypothetical protein [Vicinamibacterales bacterium]